MRHYSGLMCKSDCLEWAHWWNMRGHHATFEHYRGKLFSCYLTINRRHHDKT